MKKVGIYLITIDKYRYVGQSIDIVGRVSKHKKQLMNGKHCNKYMQDVYNKYQEFSYQILWEGAKEFLTIMEQCFINRFDNTLNIAAADLHSKSEAYKETMRNSPRVKASLAKAVEAARNTPRSEAQLDNSRRSVYLMSTPEANRKKVESRSTSAAFKEACKRNGERRMGTSCTGHKRYRGIESSQSDTRIYTFSHSKTGELFMGTRYDFASYIGVTSKALSGLINQVDTTYHKWQLSCPLSK